MHPDEIESFRLAPELKSRKIRGDLRCRVYALKGSRLPGGARRERSVYCPAPNRLG